MIVSPVVCDEVMLSCLIRCAEDLDAAQVARLKALLDERVTRSPSSRQMQPMNAPDCPQLMTLVLRATKERATSEQAKTADVDMMEIELACDHRYCPPGKHCELQQSITPEGIQYFCDCVPDDPAT
jgi:hypothetical protein